MGTNPPKRALQFLRWFCREDCIEEIEGDLVEVFKKEFEIYPVKAKWKFTWRVIKYFRPEFIKSFKNDHQNSFGMYKSYFKVGWRNLLGSKVYSLINISGLALGMAVAMLIGLWIHYELSANKSFPDHSRIGMLYHNLVFGDQIITYEGLPYSMGQELKNSFDEFEEVTMFLGPVDHIVTVDDNKFYEPGLFTDPTFIKMFPLEFIAGSAIDFGKPQTTLISKSLAETLFNGDAVGKVIRLDNKVDMVVGGVFEDFPRNSQLADVRMIMSTEYYYNQNDITKKQRENWENFGPGCYVLIKKNVDWSTLESKIKNFLFERTTENAKQLIPEALLHPMDKWNLFGDFKDGKNIGGKIRYVWMMGIIGAFVLALACINFMNLSTANSQKRSKEVGIRKVIGSVRSQLFYQFISESILVVLIGFIVSLGLVTYFLPIFNELASTSIRLPWTNLYFIAASFVFILITGVLAGSYPAIYLSAFQPLKVLKSNIAIGRQSVLARKVMLIFQFTVSTTLIICTGIIFQQIQHARNRPVGFDLKNIIQIPVKTEELSKVNYNTIRNDFLNTGVISNVGLSESSVTKGSSAEASLTWEGKTTNETPLVAMNKCSHDFPATNGFQFLEGRDFSREFITDSSAIIINELAAELFSPSKSPIGMKVTFGEKEHHVVGVIKDQIRWTPFSKQSPHIYYVDYSWVGCYTIRINPGVGTHEALSKIEAVVKKHAPGTPFDYDFQSEDYARLFIDEERISKIAGLFAGMAIFISCIGIFGLAAFSASQRNKEIGIRKVLGASVSGIWKMLSSEFVILVIISGLLACPIAYYYSGQWLQQYDYRIEISWIVFAIALVGLLAITVATVSFQAIKAAFKNPVESLRSE